MYVPEGTDITLQCLTNIAANFTWVHNSRPLVPSFDNFLMTSVQLLLRSLTEDRTGEYTCIVEAVTGISATSAYVKMGHKPVILSHDDDVTIIRSYEQEVTLDCSVTGSYFPDEFIVQLKFIKSGIGKYMEIDYV